MLKEDVDGCSNAGGRMIDGRAKSVDARANARVWLRLWDLYYDQSTQTWVKEYDLSIQCHDKQGADNEIHVTEIPESGDE